MTGTPRCNVPFQFEDDGRAAPARTFAAAMTSGTHRPAPEIWIGLDTGGTYTDAVALDGQRRVVASAKALTTHWDLSSGLGEAIRAVLANLPEATDHV